MKPTKMLQILCTRLGYKHDREDEYQLITSTRYTNTEEIGAMYVRDGIGNLFKVTCEPIEPDHIPPLDEKEYYRGIRDQLISLYESGIIDEYGKPIIT